MDTTSKGNTFREHVLALLKSKYPDAHAEGKADWKKADIIFTMMELGKRIRVAVECKNYERALTTRDFLEIQMNYQSALDCSDINLLLIVSNRPVDAASRQLIESSKTLRFMTLAELESWLVGLRPYVEALAEEFVADEVHKYYVEGRFEDGQGTAFIQVQDWIRSNEASGLAVLGGYGLGKSSLAKRVASAQAIAYLNDPENERLPILLPLGQVVHETELAGLFGKHFTYRYSLETYSYKTLLQLNAASRLLIILDGFDEMKHAMTEHDFRANFREFNKLRVPGAKILLLGRPNAFTSESSNLLIRGLSEVAGKTFVNSDFPAWLEKKLSFFTINEQRTFLNGFLRVKSSTSTTTESIQIRVEEVMQDIGEDILQRPVQARIVGLLAADPTYTFKDTNRFQLYGDFVKLVIQRDQEKRARSIIPAEDRHKFLRGLAWWAWTRPGVSQGTFRREEVPNNLFQDLSNGHALDLQSKRTEYLVSSLTEEKDSNFLYFAHRSFHEFLVAAYIASLSKVTSQTVSDISIALSEEVLDFLNESGEVDYIERIYEVIGESNDAAVSMELIDLLTSSPTIINRIANKSILKITSYDVFIMQQIYIDALLDASDFFNWLGKVLKEGKPKVADAAAFAFVDSTFDNSGNSLVIATEFLARSWERMLAEKTEESAIGLLVEEDLHCNIGDVLRTCTNKIYATSGRQVAFDTIRAHGILYNAMVSQRFIGLRRPFGAETLQVDAQQIGRKMDTASAKYFKYLFAQKAEDFRIVRRHRRPDIERKKRRLGNLS